MTSLREKNKANDTSVLSMYRLLSIHIRCVQQKSRYISLEDESHETEFNTALPTSVYGECNITGVGTAKENIILATLGNSAKCWLFTLLLSRLLSSDI